MRTKHDRNLFLICQIIGFSVDRFATSHPVSRDLSSLLRTDLEAESNTIEPRQHKQVCATGIDEGNPSKTVCKFWKWNAGKSSSMLSSVVRGNCSPVRQILFASLHRDEAEQPCAFHYWCADSDCETDGSPFEGMVEIVISTATVHCVILESQKWKREYCVPGCLRVEWLDCQGNVKYDRGLILECHLEWSPLTRSKICDDVRFGLNDT